MTAFAFYLLKVMICSGVLFLYYYLALRNKLFHQWNRFYLLSAIVLSLVAPIVQVTIMHRADETAKAIQMLEVFESAGGYLEAVTISGRPSISTDQWLMIGYITISGVFLTTVLFSFQKIISILRSHSVQWIEKIKFVNTRVQGTPFSFFNFIFWNEDIDLQTETGQQIFEHELVHVKEKHTIDKLFVQAVLIVFWCNPFFWFIRRELKIIHEFIADKKAVGEHGTTALAAMILNSSYPTHFNSLTNQFFQTSIKRRIAMLAKIQNPRINYLSRILALSIIVFTVLAFTIRTKKVAATQSQLEEPTRYTLNQQKTENKFVDTVPQKQVTIKEVTLENPKASNQDNVFRNKWDPLNPPLIILDGKEIAEKDLKKVDANNIISMTVWKGQTAKEKYGEKGRNGVIEIETKGNVEVKEVTLETLIDTVPKKRNEDINQIFTKVEIEPTVDQKQWIRHLQTQLQRSIEAAAANGIAPGTYTIQIKFVVLKDGSITDVKALNDPGYGLAEAAVKTVQKGPKWNPGLQNGKPVNAYHTQPITFVVQEQGNDQKNTASPEVTRAN